MIYIRTDANETIATGHVMRCMTIASKLLELGEEVIFVVSDEGSATLIKDRGYKYIVLNSDWSNPMNKDELDKMETILCEYGRQKGEKPKLLIDSYMINGEYTKKMKEYAVVIVIDDLFEEVFEADAIINYTLYHTRFDYAGRYGTSSKLLLGGQYVPLREQFSSFSDSGYARDVTDKQLYKVLMICGGGDKYNALGSILAKAVSDGIEKCELHVVVGAYNPNAKLLEDLAKRCHKIKLYNNVSDMAKLMSECDIAVSAASTVLYECCAMKLPTVFFCVADNQQYDRECFTKNDVMIYAGDIRTEKEQCIASILQAVEKLVGDMELRKHMISEMSTLIDGHGAMRIAEHIAGL